MASNLDDKIRFFWPLFVKVNELRKFPIFSHSRKKKLRYMESSKNGEEISKVFQNFKINDLRSNNCVGRKK